MIEVNFFNEEKKSKLPYLIGGIFLALLVLILAYFVIARTYYNNVIQDRNQWLEENSGQMSLSREMSNLDQMTKQAITAQESIVANRYPMNTLSENVISFIPDAQNTILSFQLAKADNQLGLILQNMTADELHTIVEDLNGQPYVERVQLLSLTSTGEAADQAQYSLIVNLNPVEVTADEVE